MDNFQFTQKMQRFYDDMHNGKPAILRKMRYEKLEFTFLH